MTEPEELDEDLFADLYDADEPTSIAVPPAQPKPDPVSVEPGPSDVAEPPALDVKEEDHHDGSMNMTDPNQNGYTNGQDDRENSRWDNNGRGSRMDVAVEQDSGSLGIKEDGITVVGIPTPALLARHIILVACQPLHPDAYRIDNVENVMRGIMVSLGSLSVKEPRTTFPG
ncbi:MAG: hypothetical protein Q9178_006310 [Gyalolechia marmorata]